MRDFHLMPGFVTAVFSNWEWQKVLTAGAALLLTFVFPTASMIGAGIAVGVLIILDTITGAIASYASGVEISSAKAGRMVLKLGCYGIVLLVVALAANTFPDGKSAHPFVLSLGLASIGYTEIVSIGENLDRVGFPLPAFFVRWLRGRNKALKESAKDKL